GIRDRLHRSARTAHRPRARAARAPARLAVLRRRPSASLAGNVRDCSDAQGRYSAPSRLQPVFGRSLVACSVSKPLPFGRTSHSSQLSSEPTTTEGVNPLKPLAGAKKTFFEFVSARKRPAAGRPAARFAGAGAT